MKPWNVESSAAILSSSTRFAVFGITVFFLTLWWRFGNGDVIPLLLHGNLLLFKLSFEKELIVVRDLEWPIQVPYLRLIFSTCQNNFWYRKGEKNVLLHKNLSKKCKKKIILYSNHGCSLNFYKIVRQQANNIYVAFKD